MSHMPGGVADKFGNRYEYRWSILKLLELLNEELCSVTIEAIGEDEEGIDLWVVDKDGVREGQQCKSANGSSNSWTPTQLKNKGILESWIKQLRREPSNKVSLVTPLSSSLLGGLVERISNKTSNPSDFFKHQITNTELRNFLKYFSTEANLNPTNEHDQAILINFLERITFHQVADFEMRKLIEKTIRFLFISDTDSVYDALLSFIIDKNNLAKEITYEVIYDYLISRKIEFIDLKNDPRIRPQIDHLNKKYTNTYSFINDELYEREIFQACFNEISKQKSLIIHGKGGSGKSGVTHAILEYCKENLIPVLALKLNVIIPNTNTKIWGNDLGFPASISYVMDAVSKTKQAVIILDQLDSLRWTNKKSNMTLDVCTSLIDEVNSINKTRTNKISIVFVCRTYDLDNDNHIKPLFSHDGNSEQNIWEKIEITEFSDKDVKKLVGNKYTELPSRLKDLLKLPSNLYIWKQLKTATSKKEYVSSGDLIESWINEIIKNAYQIDIPEHDIIDAINKLVTLIQKTEQLWFNFHLIGFKTSCEFLVSVGFFMQSENNIAFTHQSISDYLIAKNMYTNLLSNKENIIEIIDLPEKQTLQRRFHMQLLLQLIAESENKQQFINIAGEILNSEKIRFHIKHLVFEIISQFEQIDKITGKFILKLLDQAEYRDIVLSTIIYGRTSYIYYLTDTHIFDEWVEKQDSKNHVINLLSSIAPHYRNEEVDFFNRYLFTSEEIDKEFIDCFTLQRGIPLDEKVTDLYIHYYEKYPIAIGYFIDLIELMNQSPRLVSSILTIKLNISNSDPTYHEQSHYTLDGDLVYSDDLIELLSQLLNSLPQISKNDYAYSHWQHTNRVSDTIERIFINTMKKICSVLIEYSPNKIKDVIGKYLGKGYMLHNEIILFVLYELPQDDSDFAINCLCNNFHENIFDYTGNHQNALDQTKLILSKHSPNCSDELFKKVERNIVSYIDPKAKSWYKSRIDFFKQKNIPVYWPFWGTLQYILLPSLSSKRTTKATNELITVLKRRFQAEKELRYDIHSVHSGWVRSSIDGKEISDKHWLNIFANTKLKKDRRANKNWKEVDGGFIENTEYQLSLAFQNRVSEDPLRFINLFLENDIKNDVYVDSLFSGIYPSKVQIPTEQIEKLILKYGYNLETQRAISICRIIRNHSGNWSDEILNIIADIAINHKDPILNKPNITSSSDSEMLTLEMLESNALNCTRGQAALTIASMLSHNTKLYPLFKETIAQLCEDANPAVLYATFDSLISVYFNNDKKWACKKIFILLKKEHRLVGHNYGKDILVMIFQNNLIKRRRIRKLITKTYTTNDDTLQQKASYIIAEMYILYNKFKKIISKPQLMSDRQLGAVIEMAVLYFPKDDYNSFIKNMIESLLKNSDLNCEMQLAAIFHKSYVNLERDRIFILKLFSKTENRDLLFWFSEYLENTSLSLICYKDIIINACQVVLQHYNKKNQYSLSYDTLSKLIMKLYDEAESSENDEVKNECLNLIDMMYKKNIGQVRHLTRQLMDR